MAKKPVDVNALLGNLLGNLDKGVALDSVGKKPRVKKEKTLMDEAIATPRLNKPSLTTTRLVLIVHRTTCECCGKVTEHANKYVLAEKVDKHGNTLQTHYISEDDKDVRREKEFVDSTTAMCCECFFEGDVKAVMSQEAWDKTEPVGDKPSVDDLLKLVDSKVADTEYLHNVAKKTEKELLPKELVGVSDCDDLGSLVDAEEEGDEDELSYEEFDDIPDDEVIESLLSGGDDDEEL